MVSTLAPKAIRNAVNYALSLLTGVDHTFWCADPEESLAVDITLKPPLAGEQFFETMAGASGDHALAISPALEELVIE